VEVFIHIKKRYTYILLNIVLLIKVKIIGIIEYQILNAAYENQWMSLVVKIITMTNHYSVESQNHSCSNTTNIVRVRYASVPKFKFVLHRKYLQAELLRICRRYFEFMSQITNIERIVMKWDIYLWRYYMYINMSLVYIFFIQL